MKRLVVVFGLAAVLMVPTVGLAVSKGEYPDDCTAEIMDAVMAEIAELERSTEGMLKEILGDAAR